MVGETIAWVDALPDNYNIYEQVLKGYAHTHFEEMGEALEAVASRQYCMIITSLMLACDPAAQEQLNRYNPGVEVHRRCKAGLYFLDKLHKQSIASRTPVTVVTYIRPEGDPLLPRARKIVLGLGAKEYICTMPKITGSESIGAVFKEVTGMVQRYCLTRPTGDSSGA